MATILIVDDDTALRSAIAMALADLGHQPKEAGDGDAALIWLSLHRADAVLLDLRMPGMDGMEVLRRIQAKPDAPPVAVLTAVPTSDNTIEAMRLGAVDHLAKPIGRDGLRALLSRMLPDPATDPGVTSAGLVAREGELIGSSAAMRDVQKAIGLLADSDATVLLLGETGTGKEVVAGAIHRHGKRGKAPFVPVNCAAIPADLLESLLFGHVRGAFTGAVADRTGSFRCSDRIAAGASRGRFCSGLTRSQKLRLGAHRDIIRHRGGFHPRDGDLNYTIPQIVLILSQHLPATFMDMDLTVCICTHDRPGYVRDCLNGLGCQTIPGDRFTVLLVDSASSTDVAIELSALASDYGARLIRLGQIGVSLARNAGAWATRTQFIAYLDDDAIPASDWVETILDAINQPGRRPALIGGRILPKWEAPLPAWWPTSLLGVLWIIEHEGRGEYRTAAVPQGLEPYGANMVVHVLSLLAAGGFGNAIGRFGQSLLSDEEVQLAWMLQDAGYSVRYNSRITVYHQIQALRMKPEWLLSGFTGKGHRPF